MRRAAIDGTRSQMQSFVDQFTRFFDQTSRIIVPTSIYCFLVEPNNKLDAPLVTRPEVYQKQLFNK